MSILDKVKELEHEVEALFEGEAAKVAPAVAAVKADVVAEVGKVATVVATDWKALAMEAHDFLKTVPERFKGDAVFDSAQAFIKKIEAAI